MAPRTANLRPFSAEESEIGQTSARNSISMLNWSKRTEDREITQSNLTDPYLVSEVSALGEIDTFEHECYAICLFLFFFKWISPRAFYFHISPELRMFDGSKKKTQTHGKVIDRLRGHACFFITNGRWRIMEYFRNGSLSCVFINFCRGNWSFFYYSFTMSVVSVMYTKIFLLCKFIVRAILNLDAKFGSLCLQSLLDIFTIDLEAKRDCKFIFIILKIPSNISIILKTYFINPVMQSI